MYCRFRPPNEYEISHSTNNSVILLSQKQLIITQEKKLELKKDYVFDGLFDFDTSKEKFYDKTCKQIISNVLKGYNGGIICYGETGTGKTSTINNIIPFVISQIFDYINETDINNELFKIDVSIIEIYKEQVNDLIDIKNTNLNLIEQKNKKLIIDNLTHIGISSEEQLSKVINQGITNRNNNYPSYKEHNSKSHFIIMITLYHYYKQENYMKIGTLYLVDLEGSERISKSNIEGESLDEQKLINKSLIALSIIVQNLSNESDNITYAPYRDSKLTRILSDCFGGNAYTTLILHCSKHERSTVETRNTLMFGERAKKIKNKPVINIENNADKSIIMGEIFGLRKDSNQNYDRSYNDISNRNLGGKENQFLKLQIKQLKEKIELDNSEIEQLNERNGNLEEENRNMKNEIDKLRNRIKDEEQEDKLNSFYIKNNMNDLHNLLNEKEDKEKELINELNSLKILFDKNNKELKDIINKKDKEIKELNEAQNENIKTCQELTDCLNEASNQLKNKEKIIEDLFNKNNNNGKDINNLNNIIKNLEKEKEIMKDNLNNIIDDLEKEKESIKNNNETNLNKVNDEVNILNKKIKELNNEIKNKDNNINDLNKEKMKYLKINNENNNKINEMNNKNIENKKIIESLRKEIEAKERIIEENKIGYHKIINENIENKKMIESLREEVYTKTKLIEEKKIEYHKVINESSSDKNLVEKLKKEISAKNNTIMDYKKKIDNYAIEDSNNKKIISDLKIEIYNKERIINSYKNNESNNFNKINQEKQNLIHNIDIIKETHIKEINKYKEIIKQKEVEIVKITTEYEKRYQNGNDIYKLQKIINELKMENNELYLKLKDYDNLKSEIEYLYKRGGNYSFKETNKTSLKIAYDSLIEENKKLKERLARIQKQK